MKNLLKASAISILFLSTIANAAETKCDAGFTCSSSISIFNGEPKYKPGFKHFDYVNPEAPKGGEVKYGAIGTFDSTNPFIIKGLPAAGIGSLYESLLEGSDDEVFTKYGLLAETIKISDDKFRIRFTLRPEAKWHDGKKITADDVVFSFNTQKEFGTPQFANYYRDVKEVRKISDSEVEFELTVNDNRELPLIIGEFSIIPKHNWEGKKFDDTTLDIPLGSGPYKVEKLQPGKSISYSRVADYWGKDLPINIGRNNFDKITYDYYRDETVLVEAFKAGQFDMKSENVAKNWANSYNIPAVDSGKLVKSEVKHELPTGMQSVLLNLRRDKFSDVNTRIALTYAFDFETANNKLFFGSYQRTNSYFFNTIYAASGKITTAEEKLLEKYKGQIPEQVFTEEFKLPVSDATGANKENLLKAREYLEKAGWKMSGQGKLVNEKGEPFKIEFLLNSPAMQRVMIPYTKNLERLGIEATIRNVDPTQYETRLRTFDFDAITHVFGSGAVPGNELIAYWGSKDADKTGNVNYAGVKNPVVDELVNLVINATTQEELITACKALDRVLLWNYYMVPQYNLGKFRYLYWNKFGKPVTPPKYSIGTDTWWSDLKAVDKPIEKK